MSGQIEILGGRARSGKTAHLVELYRVEQRRLLSLSTPGHAVWITPTNRSRREILRTLLDASLRACFGPNVFTFESFAERILRTAGQAITPISPAAQRMIGRAIIDDAHDRGALEYFAPIADTSGFLDTILGVIADLKRDETWPEDFEKVCRKTGWLPRDAELSQLYKSYQEKLNGLSRYDAEGRFWSARSALAAGQRGAFSRLSLVVVDGFTDFTQPQYEILEHLAAYADRVIVSLPLQESREWADLFAKSSAALQEISNTCRITRTFLQAPTEPQDRTEISFRHIADHLFDNPRTLSKLSQADGVEIIQTAGASGEARAIAKRVKELLIEGVASDEIVIAIRGADDERELLAETMSAAGIPNECQTRVRFSQTAVVRALFNLLAVQTEDWAFDRLCALLRSNFFRPGWASFTDRGVIDLTVRVLRRERLGSGRQQILDRLSRLAAEKEGESERSQVRVAAGLLRDLSNATSRLREPADFSHWVDRIVTLCDELGIVSPKNSADAGRPDSQAALDDCDRDHWQRLKNVLYDAIRVLSQLGDKREMPLAAFVKQLRDLLDSQTFATTPSDTGSVRILEASEVRNLDVPFLFFAGLSESSFPRGRQDDCLYTEAERRQFLHSGRANAALSSPQQDEMLLFYSIVTRARRKLTLSYPSVSSSGQPLFPSPYLDAVRQLFDLPGPSEQIENDLDPVPERTRSLTAADLRLLATDEVRDEKPGLFRTLAERPDFAAVARGVLASAEMAAARFEQHGFTSFEGMLRDGKNLRRVAERFSREMSFSATQLESYATCPFRFLLEHVLKIEACDSPESGTDSRARGIALHQILSQLHAPSATSREGELPPNGSQLAVRLRELISDQFHVPEDATLFERALLTAERHYAEHFADRYGAQWDAYRQSLGGGWEENLQPRFVEWSFGETPGRKSAGSSSVAAFATFGPEETKVRVGGRIDRIDVGRRNGTETFAVIDYKTTSGRSFTQEEIGAGLALQLAVYVSAIRQSGILSKDAALFQMMYWNLARSGCVPGFKANKKKTLEPLDGEFEAAIEQTLHELLPKMTTRIRGGEFPVQNADQRCTSYCPYSTVCRVNQIRPLARERDKRWELSQR